jgi:site-specific recombinase XerD
MPAEVDLTLPLPGLSPVCGKPIVARFDGGRLSSDGGILLLAEVERRLGIAERLARCIEDRRAPDQIRHEVATAEVHALLGAAGSSSHGHGRRDYALVQLLLQTGLRVGEVAALRRSDIEVRERTGQVRVRDGKGGKAREVPLNATARRALRLYLEQRPDAAIDAPVFLSGRNTSLPVRSIQAIVSRLARRAHLVRQPVSPHTLRHTFALSFLRANPGRLVELASLLGHESLDTTAVYTRPSRDDLATDLERSPLNVDR